MGTIYIDAAGGSTTNSGSTNNAAADVTLTINAGEAFADATLLVDVNTGALTSIVTSGSTQSTIYFTNATNANKKIFWISAYDNVSSPKTITVDTIPTGLTAGTSTGTIGGQWKAPVNTGMSTIDSASTLRPGDVVQFNDSPATSTQDFLTCRAAGTSAGRITVKGKSGVRPVITVSNTTQCIENNASNFAGWWFENLEMAQQGASGNVVFGMTATVFYNVKIGDGGGDGISVGAGGNIIIASEITGLGASAISTGTANAVTSGNYLHDVATNGISEGGGNTVQTIDKNIIDTCGGRGIQFTGSPSNLQGTRFISGNTIYGCGDSGIEVSNASHVAILINNILSENGNAAGEYNVEFVAGAAEIVSFHAWNVFYHSGGGGGSNLLNLTVNAQVASSEFTTDPQFTATGNKTFTSGDVNTTAETITITAHGYTAGQVVMMTSTTGAVPTGVALNTPYYVMVTDANTIQLSLTYASPAAINLTAAGSGTTTIHNGATANFAIGSTSPAKAAGYPGAFLGGSTGYLDIGAVQRQEAGGGGGPLIGGRLAI